MNTSLIRRGEFLMALGLAGVAASTVLFSFVMIGLLAIPLFPVALGLLLTGLVLARDNTAPALRQAAGIILLLVAIAALVRVSALAVHLGHEHALHLQRPARAAPSLKQWMLSAASWLVPVLLLGFGLRLWTNWSVRRRVAWGVAVLAVPPMALVSFRILTVWLPIDA